MCHEFIKLSLLYLMFKSLIAIIKAKWILNGYLSFGQASLIIIKTKGINLLYKFHLQNTCLIYLNRIQ